MREDIEILFKDLDSYISKLEELILHADSVARKRGDKFGLCDSFTERAGPYPSQWGADIIREIRENRGLPDPSRRRRRKDRGWR